MKLENDVEEKDIKGNCMVEFLCLIKEKSDTSWWKKFVELIKKIKS